MRGKTGLLVGMGSGDRGQTGLTANFRQTAPEIHVSLVSPRRAQSPERPALRVHVGELLAHLVGLRLNALDLNQPAFADSGTPGRRFLPGSRMVYQLGPEREDPALGWFRRMDAATALDQEVTVGPPGDAEAQAIARPVDILTLESGRGHAHKPGGTHQVCLRQVNKPLLRATFRTSRLAFKPNSLPHCSIIMGNRVYFCDIVLLFTGKEGVYVLRQRDCA